MAKRKLFYWLWLASRSPFYWLTMPVLRWMYRHHIRGKHKSILLVDWNNDPGDDDAFVRDTMRAVDLIESLDPRRFRILQREIRYIVNQELVSSGAYVRPLRACEVDFGRYHLDQEGDQYGRYFAHYILTLVHEATHGRLESMGFPYTPALRVWLERMCVTEEQRFARRLKASYCDFGTALVPRFIPERWAPYWSGGRWRQLKELFMRMRQSEEKAARRSSMTNRP